MNKRRQKEGMRKKGKRMNKEGRVDGGREGRKQKEGIRKEGEKGARRRDKERRKGKEWIRTE